MKLLMVAALVLATAGCSPVDLLQAAGKAALGGGSGISSDIQAGAQNQEGLQNTVETRSVENSQGNTIDQSSGDNGVRSESVGSVQIVQSVPAWIWISWGLLLAAAVVGWLHGWVTASPREKRLINRLINRDPV